MNNCVDYPCKYRLDDCHDHNCALHSSKVPDDVDETSCEDFILAQTCLDCRHHRLIS